MYACVYACAYACTAVSNPPFRKAGGSPIINTFCKRYSRFPAFWDSRYSSFPSCKQSPADHLEYPIPGYDKIVIYWWCVRWVAQPTGALTAAAVRLAATQVPLLCCMSFYLLLQPTFRPLFSLALSLSLPPLQDWLTCGF